MKRQRSRRKKRIIIGITGSFGSGKTAVARIFKSLGAEVIDADRIAHSIINRVSSVYKKIINTFGEGILKKDKNINRDKLANIVFNHKNLLKRLNLIMHPEIIRIIKDKIKTSPAEVIVLDAPLLIEAGLKNLVDKLIVVKINKRVQLERLLNKTHQSRTDILKRIKYQVPQEDKVRMADFVIDNSGTIEKTKKKIRKIRRLLWKN